MSTTISLAGQWQLISPAEMSGNVLFPGTLDTNGIGPEDREESKEYGCGSQGPIVCRLTRKHAFTGTISVTRPITFKPGMGQRVFFEVERARKLSVSVNGRPLSPYRPQTLSTPQVFEVTDSLTGKDNIQVDSDNTYQGMPAEAIINSSGATNHTQTNWNGLLGYIRLRVEENTFIDRVRVYPLKKTLTVKVDIDSQSGFEGRIRLSSGLLREPLEEDLAVGSGKETLVYSGLPINPHAQRWDEYQGELYDLRVELLEGSGRSVVTEATVRTGIRDYGIDDHGRLTINGRVFFLRGETNCAEFPETGFSPMDVSDWIRILDTYRSYGVNLVRFHSHCPPEAAFIAADQQGMMMQPELSHWDYRHAFETSESYEYYRRELEQTLLVLANHPSFVMLTLGNELAAGKLGHERMALLIEDAKSIDSTRLYANSSNPHYGSLGCDPCNDVYTAMAYQDHDLRCCYDTLRGSTNSTYPGTHNSFTDSMQAFRSDNKVPVYSFEVGQYEVLPDFREIKEFKGVTRPDNYRHIQEGVKQAGLDSATWDSYIAASGELARLCYREEVESVLRTPAMSGISLLGLQDFPGQGTALVGMMDAHMQPKRFSFAQPERFRSFYTAQIPLFIMDRYTYTNKETLVGRICIANYGQTPIEGNLQIRLRGKQIDQSRIISGVNCPIGQLTEVGKVHFSLNEATRNQACKLSLNINGIKNTYPVWIYDDRPVHKPDRILEARHFDSEVERELDRGGIVYLSPDSSVETLPTSVQAHFSTDFWSVGTFRSQSGTMGQYIDKSHPLFRDFPTEEYTNWQWWPMATQRAIVLPEPYQSIITEMDSYAYLRPMTQLLECRCGHGRLLLSSLGLQNLMQYPEARALEGLIYQYLASDNFKPEQCISPQVISSLVA